LARRFISRRPADTSILIQPPGVQPRVARGLLEALRANLGSSLGPIRFRSSSTLAAAPREPPPHLSGETRTAADPDKIYVSPAAFTQGAGLRPLRDLDVAYVAVNRYNDGHPAFGPLQAALVREGRLLATFSPYRAEVSPDRRAGVAPFFHNTADRIDPALERPGPIIEIWRIN
jgi:hypothetical protein